VPNSTFEHIAVGKLRLCGACVRCAVAFGELAPVGGAGVQAVTGARGRWWFEQAGLVAPTRGRWVRGGMQSGAEPYFVVTSRAARGGGLAKCNAAA